MKRGCGKQWLIPAVLAVLWLTGGWYNMGQVTGAEDGTTKAMEIWLEKQDGTRLDTSCVAPGTKDPVCRFFFDGSAYLMVRVLDPAVSSVQAQFFPEDGGQAETVPLICRQNVYMAALPEQFRGTVQVTAQGASGWSESCQIAGKIVCESAKEHKSVSHIQGSMTDTDLADGEGLPLYVTEPEILVQLQDEISGIRQVEWEIAPAKDTSDPVFSRRLVIDQAGGVSGDQDSATVERTRENQVLGLQVREKQELADGTYRFWIRMTDAAGHRAQWNCTFGIDRADPKIVISGVSQDGVYGGTVSPVVTCEDANYKPGSLKVQLRSESGDTLWEYPADQVSSDARCEVSWFGEHTEAQADGNYVLWSYGEDLAGHGAETEVHFLVNRFGSVYRLSGETEAVQGSYLTGSCDLVLTESNLSPLEPEHTVIKVNHNGTMRELVLHTDYEMEYENTEGWNVYTYRLKKEAFSEDGAYTVYIQSRDTAGNQNASVRQKALSFAVDTTPPQILTLQDEGGETVFQITDNLKLKEVHMYVGEEEVSYTVDANTYRAELSLDEQPDMLRVLAEDMAGNSAEYCGENVHMPRRPVSGSEKDISGHIEEGFIKIRNYILLAAAGAGILILLYNAGRI